MNLFFQEIQTPVGRLKMVASDIGLKAVLWEEDSPRRIRLEEMAESSEHAVLRLTAKQLTEYFEADRQTFTVPLDFAGTPFQRKVWAELLRIPFGKTRTYGEIARAIDNPGAVRAVGLACGKNPISIIAPCHRVVGSRGTLGGFAGGPDVKRYLLKLEWGVKTDPDGLLI